MSTTVRHPIAAALIAALATAAVIGTSDPATAQDRQTNPCRELAAAQCAAETHCRYRPAATITYDVAGKTYQRQRKAACTLAIKIKAATVTKAE